MARLFLAFLGTSHYAACRYQMDGVTSAPLRFIIQPLIGKMEKAVAPFRGDLVADGIQAVRWCAGHQWRTICRPYPSAGCCKKWRGLHLEYNERVCERPY